MYKWLVKALHCNSLCVNISNVKSSLVVTSLYQIKVKSHTKTLMAFAIESSYSRKTSSLNNWRRSTTKMQPVKLVSIPPQMLCTNGGTLPIGHRQMTSNLTPCGYRNSPSICYSYNTWCYILGQDWQNTTKVTNSTIIKSPLHYTLLLQTLNLTLISTVIKNHARSTTPIRRSSCCTHWYDEEANPQSSSSFPCYTYIQLELNRTVWWLPIILQVSGQLVHLAKGPYWNTLRSPYSRHQLHPLGVCPQFFGQFWLQEVW